MESVKHSRRAIRDGYVHIKLYFSTEQYNFFKWTLDCNMFNNPGMCIYIMVTEETQNWKKTDYY